MHRRQGRARVIRGRRGWWFIGPGGIARLSAGQLMAGGGLRPAAEQRLRGLGLFTAPPVRSYALTVLTSTSCNAGCGYCFQNTGQDLAHGAKPPRIPRASLSVADISAVLSFAGQRMADAGLAEMTIMLFGGEPLLNLRACRELLIRAADYGLASAAIATNGILLTPAVADRLWRVGLRWAQITFDGDRDDHDRVRRTRLGMATFDLITGNVRAAARAAPIRWRLRVNVSRDNADGIGALVGRLAERLDPAACSMVFAIAGDTGIGYRGQLTVGDELAAAFAGWQRLAVDAGFRVELPRADTACQMCGYPAGRFGAVVNPDGTLSSCWETAGRPEWTVGRVTVGYVSGPELDRLWATCAASRLYTADRRALWVFRDKVDADLLDYLDGSGRLAAGQAGTDLPP